jgi:nitroimidazol reductase NimA-like FMN-containing flavoprotein (pyridoxamine 5'-phosphate oxidase superfamily)
VTTLSETPLSPSPRTRITRGRERAVDDRADLHAFLGDALIAHIGVNVGEHPVVLPTAFAVDPEGPDQDGTLYVHGSVAAGWVRRSGAATVCVTITELDGLVAGRSAFHHSMNYRSAVVIGEARLVTDTDERERALAMIVDHMIPGRSETLRPHSRKELAATAVLALPLHDASMKARAGDPVDEPEDVEAGVWGGVIPLRRVSSAPVPSVESQGPVPADVVRRAEALA